MTELEAEAACNVEEEEEMTIDAGIDYAVLDDLSNDEDDDADVVVTSVELPGSKKVASKKYSSQNTRKDSGRSDKKSRSENKSSSSQQKSSVNDKASSGSGGKTSTGVKGRKRDDVDNRKVDSGKNRQPSRKVESHEKPSGSDTGKDQRKSTSTNASTHATGSQKDRKPSSDDRRKTDLQARDAPARMATTTTPRVAENKTNGDSVPVLTVEEQGLRCKKEYTDGMARSDRKKIVLAYPLSSSDLSSSYLQMLIAKSRHVHWMVDQLADFDKPHGMLSVVCHTMEYAEEVEKSLRKIKNNLYTSRLRTSSKDFEAQSLMRNVVKPFSGNFTKEEKKRWENSILIKDLPGSVTETKLLKMFPQCRVTIPLDNAGKKKRHALVEYVNRDMMLSALTRTKQVTLDGHQLKLRDLMKSDVTPLVPKKILSKVQDLAALRHDLAKEWETFSVEGRTSLIKNIYMQECQLKVDEQAKLELGLKLGSKWQWELEKQLRSSSFDIPESLKHLASMHVASLTKKVRQLSNRRVRAKVRGRTVRATALATSLARPGGVSSHGYGGHATKLLSDAKKRMFARNAKTSATLFAQQKRGRPMRINQPAHPTAHLPASNRAGRSEHQSVHATRRPHHADVHHGTALSLKRPAPATKSSHSDSKRRRQDLPGDSRRMSDRFDARAHGAHAEQPENRKRHNSAGDNHKRRSSESHRLVHHSRENSTRDRYSRPQESTPHARSSRNGGNFSPRGSSSSYTTTSPRELSQYYSNLSRSQRQERSPHQERSSSTGASRSGGGGANTTSTSRGSDRRGNAMAPEAVNLLMGLSQILKKQAVTETVRSTISQVSTPTSYQHSSHGSHRQGSDSYSRQRDNDSRRGGGGSYSSSTGYRY